MIPSLRATALLVILLPLAGCAPVDWSEAVVETRSNCHTSTGAFVAAPSCNFSHSKSVSRTSTTTTTTEDASENAPPSTTGHDEPL